VYALATEIAKKAKTTQVAILLHCAGPEAQEIHSTFTFANEDDVKDTEAVLKKFTDYCEPRKNTVFERYKFWQRNQHEQETTDQWVTDLRTRAASCEFGDSKDLMIRDHIVFGVSDDRIKERLLREKDLTLDKAVDICRAAEISRLHVQTMSSSSTASVQAITRNSKQDKQSRYKQSTYRGPAGAKIGRNLHECKFCGTKHLPKRCPAYGKTCAKCHRKNNFAVVCWGESGLSSNTKKKMHTL
jgi:hypothetical protein